MLQTTTATRRAGRTAGRWFGVIAAAAVIALGASACSGDTAALSSKNVGDDVADSATIAQVNDPVIDGDLIATKEADGGDGAGFIPDEIEGDVKTAQEVQAGVEVPTITDDSDLVTAEHSADQVQRVEQVHEAMPQRGGLPMIDMRISTVVPLQRVAWSQTSPFEGCATDGFDRPFYTLEVIEQANYCFKPKGGSIDSWVDVKYQIGDTPEILHITSRVPFMGDNVLTCDILNNGDNKPVLGSKYVCEKKWLGTEDGYGHGNNPQPFIVLKEKPTKQVKDLSEAQKLIKENCVDKTGRGACDYSAATQKAYLQPASEWRLYGGPQTNCNTPEAEEHNVKDGVKIAWEDRFGVAVKVDVKDALELIKAGLEVSYEHAVTEERMFEEERRGFVEYGTMHAWYIQPGMVRTTGDITIVTPYNIYKLANQQFDIPLSKNWQPIEGRGQTVSKDVAHSTHVKINCKDGSPVDELPEFPARGVPEGAQDLKGLKIAPTATFTSQPESLAAKDAQ